MTHFLIWPHTMVVGIRYLKLISSEIFVGGMATQLDLRGWLT